MLPPDEKPWVLLRGILTLRNESDRLALLLLRPLPPEENKLLLWQSAMKGVFVMAKKTKKLTINAMMAAMCAVLGYLALDMGNLKVTFESLPILISALMFGPADGMIVGGMGTLVYQLLKYGVSATTLLWMAPYIICGLVVGLYAKKNNYSLSKGQIMFIVIVNELLITALNTGVLYIDSKLYGYYSAAFIFGSLVPRIAICVGKAIVFGLVLPGLTKALKHQTDR